MRCGGKVALVTGGQQGIGRAIALALACEGADVVLNYLDDPDAAAGVAKKIRETGRRCLSVQGDVSSSADVAALVDAAERGMGPVDTLVNNAGIFPRAPFLDVTEAEWDRVHGVNKTLTLDRASKIFREVIRAQCRVREDPFPGWTGTSHTSGERCCPPALREAGFQRGEIRYEPPAGIGTRCRVPLEAGQAMFGGLLQA
jgi:NAD(P)-dependent dehydrogenase (short-subunit alcohol dehydrogenase family)